MVGEVSSEKVIPELRPKVWEGASPTTSRETCPRKRNLWGAERNPRQLKDIRCVKERAGGRSKIMYGWPHGQQRIWIFSLEQVLSIFDWLLNEIIYKCMYLSCGLGPVWIVSQSSATGTFPFLRSTRLAGVARARRSLRSFSSASVLRFNSRVLWVSHFSLELTFLSYSKPWWAF